MVGTQKNLTEQVKTAYEAHRSASDCWKEGNVKDFWIDDDGNLCIMYDSGKWWHYKDLELPFPTWW